MSDAVCPKGAVTSCSCTDLRLQNSMHVIVMARDALAFAAQHASILEPVPHAVQDDDFVPESSFRDDGCHALGGQAKSGHLV